MLVVGSHHLQFSLGKAGLESLIQPGVLSQDPVIQSMLLPHKYANTVLFQKGSKLPSFGIILAHREVAHVGTHTTKTTLSQRCHHASKIGFLL